MDREEQRQRFIDIMAKFTVYTGRYLPDDVLSRLEELRETENSDLAKIIYDAMFENLKMAEELNRPCCQDTGVIQYFVQVGTKFPLIGEIEECLREAVQKATVIGPLRHNAVEVFDEKNTGNNVGTRIPWIDWEIIPDSDEVIIYVYMAGGGCSLPGAAKVLMPLEGYEGVVKFVFDQITSYGINACPPLLVGIGIAGSVEVAAKLSKKALLRPLGSHNNNPRGAELEKRIEKGLNDVKIGPGGLTGENSVMGVHIEQAARHPATIAVGLSTGCWAHRRSVIKISADMEYETISHKGAIL
ncbi:Fe-S hydro-lyase, tartrate dehydratase alpha-type, catalytic domain [Syntrophomonas zehnderi OL-4]|uniref:L(+)-tartrate dehydratase subunit alpha n=1 Tax=Syntrophomonas zehnderi OL-4 TaxID=690567 RepID=A0A0E3W337_9FIRM|nr:L(+)-tartrate dehydratase subunit alpha [Syntrophomonas zehnderi]CFX46260.1 Fe-S hydro-lyase, tartrate dehydratase alpha-type, catalytic domain [Syntrophomonas zehnderi OL-4]